jgi:hypothetical protein
MTETYGAKALRVALAEDGVKESPAGSNSGPRVRQYQAACDLGGTGWPWCAGFALWAYERAGARQPYRSPSVAHLLNWYRRNGRVIGDRRQVRPGDFVVYDWNGDGWSDHVGIFRRWMADDRSVFECVEGNTAVGNDSNGGQVMVRYRHADKTAVFVRPVGSRVPAGVKFDPVSGVAKPPLHKRALRYLGRH